MPSNDKIDPTYEEVEEALAGSGTRPRSVTDVALHIASHHGLKPDGAKEIRKAVSMSQLEGRLGQLSLNGRAREFRGKELRDFYDRRPTGRYWVHADHLGLWTIVKDVEEREARTAAQRDQRRREAAEQAAREELARRYPQEFEELVTANLANSPKES